jgi:hypothetical protein
MLFHSVITLARLRSNAAGEVLDADVGYGILFSDPDLQIVARTAEGHGSTGSDTGVPR